jgi:hypothetical protein
LQAYKAAPLQAAEQFEALGKKTFFENEGDDEDENDRLVALTTPIRRHSDTPRRLIDSPDNRPNFFNYRNGRIQH